MVNNVFSGTRGRGSKPAGIIRIGKGALAGVAVSERIRKVVRLKARGVERIGNGCLVYVWGQSVRKDSKGRRGVVDDSELERGARGLFEARKSK